VHSANRFRTDSLTRRLWNWTVGLGLVCALAVSFATPPLDWINHRTLMGIKISTGPLLKRISGFRPSAEGVERAAAELKRDTGREPFYVASTYGRAALLAFYMKEHPVVACADSYMGGRESSYDYFPDTDLSNPALLGRPAILLGRSEGDVDLWVWEKALYFQCIERSRFFGRIYFACEYRGPCREPHMKNR